jgi:hypothetical protein
MKVIWRVEKLEAVARSARRRLAIVWLDADEDEDTAMARWMAANDGEADPRTGPATVLFISWLPAAAAKGEAACQLRA